jgi:hypothetical protein
MIPITAIYPRPRKVACAGHSFLVNEARVCDLIALQGYIDDRATRPLEALRARLGRLDVPEARDALAGLLDDLEADPPMWGNEAGARFFAEWDGIVFWMGVIIGQCNAITPAFLDWIAHHATEAEWESMKREWRRIDPRDEVESLLGIEGEQGEPVPWPRAICEVVEITGWTLETIANLHMSQIRAIRCGGKQEERGTQVMPGQSVAEVQRMVKARHNRIMGNGNGKGT